MKLLFDQNLSFKLCENVADLFPESAHVRFVGLSEADDRTIWEHAKTTGFAIVSLDGDFAEMAAFLNSPPPKVIWLRTRNQPTAVVAMLLRHHASLIAAFGNDDDMACLEIY